jgi:sirohydrochlorin ferrochelatase
VTEPLTLLVDNGSLVPAATLRLREIARAVAQKISRAIEPVSMLHSSAVPVEQIGGVAAEILEPALQRRLEQGRNDFIILPLFFGPSRALTDYLPERVAHLRKKFPALRVRAAPTLFEPTDDRLAKIMAEQVRERWNALTSTRSKRLEDRPLSLLRVALVDHGSPAREVVAVRDQLAAQLRTLLGPDAVVAASSMERRPGPDYAFGDPLLENLLKQPEWSAGDVIVAMQFLLPGRHAGPNGDVAAICQRATEARPGLRLHQTALVGEHPLLSEILADRWRVPATTL